MIFLTRDIEKTANIAGGYTVGTLVIDGGIFNQLDDGNIILTTGYQVEVKNGDHWQPLSAVDVLRKTHEGWPAYAGLTARMKKEVTHERTDKGKLSQPQRQTNRVRPRFTSVFGC